MNDHPQLMKPKAQAAYMKELFGNEAMAIAREARGMHQRHTRERQYWSDVIAQLSMKKKGE